MFLIRELAGWLFVILGLISFWITWFSFLRNGLIFQAGPMSIVGIVLFRAGIHLLKVATAARLMGSIRPADKTPPTRFAPGASRPQERPRAGAIPVSRTPRPTAVRPGSPPAG